MLSKKAEKAAKDYARRTPPQDLCLARVASGDRVRQGSYNLLPILCSMRKGKNASFVLLTLFLLRLSDQAHVGVLIWMLPFNERTEQSVAKLLASFGWDGRVWPDDPGWPKEDTMEGKGLLTLLKGANLLATLTFPPDGANGNQMLRQEILRTSADFPLSPDLGDGAKAPTPGMIEKLRKLAEDPVSVFGVGESVS